MRHQEYVSLLDNTLELNSRIKKLSNSERIKLRQELESQGETRILRSLVFNYETQEWLLEEVSK